MQVTCKRRVSQKQRGHKIRNQWHVWWSFWINTMPSEQTGNMMGYFNFLRIVKFLLIFSRPRSFWKSNESYIFSQERRCIPTHKMLLIHAISRGFQTTLILDQESLLSKEIGQKVIGIIKCAASSKFQEITKQLSSVQLSTERNGEQLVKLSHQ